MAYQLNEKRSPEYVRIVPASGAVPIPEKREPKYVVFIDESGNPIDIGGGSVSVTWADITGKPTTFPASKLATARTISLTGGATGSANFDGSANAAIAVTLSAATTAAAGAVKQAAAQANSAATDVAGLVADFNALLAKLKAAGIMA